MMLNAWRSRAGAASSDAGPPLSKKARKEAMRQSPVRSAAARAAGKLQHQCNAVKVPGTMQALAEQFTQLPFTHAGVLGTPTDIPGVQTQ